MNYAEIKYCDISNGPGCRVSLFVSGCENRCPGCFNKVAWDFDYGEKFDYTVMDRILSMSEPYWIQGLSVLGGEPLDPNNILTVANIAERFKDMYPEKDIWLYTGYTLEQIEELSKDIDYLMAFNCINGSIDVLVEGPFIESEKDISLRFKGSRNQRIIDVVKSDLPSGKLELWEE